MRNKLITMMLIGVALLAGCSFSAGISRGDDKLSVIVDRDDMRRVHNSTVRIRAYNSKNQLIWMGTGSVFKIENNRIHILSNNHVCNGAPKITVEPVVNGRSLGEFIARVDLCVEENSVDVAVVSLPQGSTLKYIEFVPILSEKLKVGDEIYWVGCDGGNQQNGQIGRILMVSDDYIYCSPKSIGGDSGSSIVQFDEEGNPHVVALIAWVTQHNGKMVAMAMPSHVVLDVLAGGKLPELPDEGDVPPDNLETERLIQGLLERLREMREQNSRERQGLLDRLSQMQIELAMKDQETQLFRDRFGKWQKDTDDNLGRIEDKEDGIVEGLSRKFDNLKTLLKWSFYGLIALLIAALFFKQGWATTVIICMVTFVFRTCKLAYLLIHRAVVAKAKNPKSITEALDGLTDGISEGIGRKDDPPTEK